MANSENTKKRGIMKPITIIITAFLMVPILTLGTVYFADENFRYKADETLSSYLPGSLGAEFAKKPTKEEKQQIKIQIAKKYITYEEDRLSDKLEIIKGENLELYNELIILLARENSAKMRKVQESLRLRELKSDTLQKILSEIDGEQDEAVDSLIQYYSSLKTSGAIKEIERTYNSGELSTELLPLVFDKLPIEQSAFYLENLEEDLRQKIEVRLNPSKKVQLEKVIEGNKRRRQELMALADVYKETPMDELVAQLGTNDQFNTRDLAQIYQGMPVAKAGEILAKVEDQEFIAGLYEEISELERLNSKTSGLSNKLSSASLIFLEYEKKLQELALVYEKLPIVELANLLEEMLKTDKVYQKHQLGGDVEIVFTQEQLVVDVLRRLKPTHVAKLMEELKTNRSVELSKKLITN